MLAIFDGPEESGKTWICRQIQEWWPNGDVVYVHHGPGDSNFDRIEKDLTMAFENLDILYLFDRWWVSELVYRPHDLKMPSIPLNPWQMEQKYGRKADQIGKRYLVLEHPDILQQRRNDKPGGYDGIDINPFHEYLMYDMLCSPAWERISSRTFDIFEFYRQMAKFNVKEA